ncbi:MAG: GNAT family N-acetyltransferase [archaeon]
MVEYRPFPDERREEFSRLLSYAFSPEDGPYDSDEGDELPPQARLGENRGLFEESEPVSVCRHYYFDTYVRGSNVKMAGLSAVATPPEHRRRGLIRRLLRESLKEYRDRGAVISSLWPFSTPFYAQFGWATAARVATQTAAPSTFRIDESDDANRRFYRASEDDWRSLDTVLETHANDYELAIDRTESWWRNRAFHRWDFDPYVYVVERDGEPVGYVVYSVTADGDEKELRVWDMAFVDPSAHRAVLRFVADHDSQVSSVRITGPPGEVVLDQVDDPASLDLEIEAGPMVRLVDLEPALEAISYPRSLSGRVTVAVDDPLVDWNDGRFALSFEVGRVTVEATDSSPAVELGVGALSQLFVGYRSFSDLWAANEVTVTDTAGAELLATAFPESAVYLREGF